MVNTGPLRRFEQGEIVFVKMKVIDPQPDNTGSIWVCGRDGSAQRWHESDIWKVKRRRRKYGALSRSEWWMAFAAVVFFGASLLLAALRMALDWST